MRIFLSAAILLTALNIFCLLSAQESQPSADPALKSSLENIKKETKALNRRIEELNNAIVELNNKNFQLEEQIRVSRAVQADLLNEKVKSESYRRKDELDAQRMSKTLQDQKKLLEDLDQEVRLIKKTLLSLEERQSAGTFSLKQDYNQEFEKTRKSTKFLNMTAIIIGLIAIAMAY